MTADITITKDGERITLDEWIRRREESTIDRGKNYRSEASRYDKSIPHFRRAKNTKNQTGVLRTKVFSEDQIQKENEKMATSKMQGFVEDVLKVLARKPGILISAEHVFKSPETEGELKDYSLAISRFKKFCVDEEISGVTFEMGQRRRTLVALNSEALSQMLPNSWVSKILDSFTRYQRTIFTEQRENREPKVDPKPELEAPKAMPDVEPPRNFTASIVEVIVSGNINITFKLGG